MNKTKNNFFFLWSVGFLIIAIIGFIPTFLLRPWFRESELPAHLIIHGVIMLAWFSVYFYQNLLITNGKVVNHMKFGIWWFLLAILMTVANFNVVFYISDEIVTGTPTYFGKVRTVENSGGLVIGNLFITIFSSVLILIAYLKRRKPNVHKRAILGAGFLLLTPAFDRFIRPFGLPEIFQFLGSFIIPISLLGYDIIKKRKAHPMTLLVLAIAFLMIPVLAAIMNNESFITTIIQLLA